MKILVCISNVPDTTTKIKFTSDGKQFDATGVQWIINPWDELALTRALELKETTGGLIENITVINVGTKDTEITIRKALSVGADHAVRIDAIPTDAYAVASEIAKYVETHPFDLILTGIESSDYNGNAVGGMLAELLNIPSVSSVSSIEINEGKLIITREIDGGKQILDVPTPLVAIVQKGIAKEPRIPSMRGIMAARTKVIEVVNPINVAPLTDYILFELPQPKGKCKMIPADQLDELIHVLHQEIKAI
ncbi:MAG: electron transfer flavoprotein subunit beta/FixA family protein [Bacteroidales bacterium]|nr:electron transfer flavoprotein subunit beta/FixA family protein [Bacteroidales bacterium]